ncbi:MAG: hypothetical protein A2340_09475 [Lentisphaerae bacterium RIFOXYB12_FULL_60_10]|nr:MAG: hypothetical protein A2340_09475 [Lentisphaerae bacterium RIFOXYB12_FULL_60_10]
MTRVVPINVAEAFVDIFHDPELSALPRWKVQPGKAHGLKVKQIWCAATFEWMRRPAGRRPALCMERRLNLDCSRYGNLLVCIWAPLKARVRVTAWTDRGIRTVLAPPAGPDKREVALPLRLEGRTAIITGRRGRVEIRIPDGWQARVDEIQPDTKHWPEHRRLTLKKEGRSGTIKVQAHLIPTSR